MASKSPVTPVSQRRSDLLLAGLSWHALFETDLQERERKVSEFAQAQGIDRMCVLENPNGLQIGYCGRGQTPVTELRRPRLFSFVLAVRKYFITENLLLVWKIQTDDEVADYAVLIFENGFLVLDYVAPARAVEDVITTYLENSVKTTGSQYVTNDTKLFPEFTDIAGINWFSDSVETALLRPPRKPRLVDPKKRPVQAFILFVALVASCLALAWYVWSEFIAKPRTTTVKPKLTAQQRYSREVFEKVSALGWTAQGVQSVMLEMMTMPLTHEGWQLRLGACAAQDCRYTWVGSEGTDPRVLSALGKEIKRSMGIRENRVEMSKVHAVPFSGPDSADHLSNREDTELFCQRENLVLRELKIKANLQCTGIFWPEAAPQVLADFAVHRYPVSITGDWVSIDRALERYAGSVYWREVKFTVEPMRTDLLELLQFELNGDLYGYR